MQRDRDGVALDDSGGIFRLDDQSQRERDAKEKTEMKSLREEMERQNPPATTPIERWVDFGQPGYR